MAKVKMKGNGSGSFNRRRRIQAKDLPVAGGDHREGAEAHGVGGASSSGKGKL